METEDKFIGIHTEELEINHNGFTRTHEVVYGSYQEKDGVRFVEILRKEKYLAGGFTLKTLMMRARVELGKRGILKNFGSRHLQGSTPINEFLKSKQ